MRLRPAYELWMGTFTTRDGGGLRANAQRGTCAASDRPLGERQMRHGGLIPTRASSQRPSLWHRRGRPLRGQACGSLSPRTPCVRVLRLHPVGGFLWKEFFVRCFEPLGGARSMLFASSASNDCECTNTLAHKAQSLSGQCSLAPSLRPTPCFRSTRTTLDQPPWAAK